MLCPFLCYQYIAFDILIPLGCKLTTIYPRTGNNTSLKPTFSSLTIKSQTTNVLFPLFRCNTLIGKSIPRTRNLTALISKQHFFYNEQVNSSAIILQDYFIIVHFFCFWHVHYSSCFTSFISRSLLHFFPFGIFLLTALLQLNLN